MAPKQNPVYVDPETEFDLPLPLLGIRYHVCSNSSMKSLSPGYDNRDKAVAELAQHRDAVVVRIDTLGRQKVVDMEALREHEERRREEG